MSVAKADLLCVARVLKSNGADGEVIIGFSEIDPEEINLKEPLYIYFDGLAVPFFIESFAVKGSRAFVRLTSVKNLKDAAELEGRDVFVRRGSVNEYDGAGEVGMDDILGWTVLNEYGISVGTVSGWEDIPGNPCLYVAVPDDGKPGSGSEVMIPFQEDLIIDIDQQGRKIKLHIPEGLI